MEDILAQAKAEGLTYKAMTISTFKELWPVLRPYSVQQIGAALSRCGIEAAKGAKGVRIRELPTPHHAGTPWTP